MNQPPQIEEQPAASPARALTSAAASLCRTHSGSLYAAAAASRAAFSSSRFAAAAASRSARFAASSAWSDSMVVIVRLWQF
jgi:hypothetical protein